MVLECAHYFCLELEYSAGFFFLQFQLRLVAKLGIVVATTKAKLTTFSTYFIIIRSYIMRDVATLNVISLSLVISFQFLFVIECSSFLFLSFLAKFGKKSAGYIKLSL